MQWFTMVDKNGGAEPGRLLHLYSQADAKLSEQLVALSRSAGSRERGVFDSAWEQCLKARSLRTGIQGQIYESLGNHRVGG